MFECTSQQELETAGEDVGLGTIDKITRVMNQTRRGKCRIEPDTSAVLSDNWDTGSKLQIRVANRTYKPWPQGYYLQNTYFTNCLEQEQNMDVFPRCHKNDIFLWQEKFSSILQPVQVNSAWRRWYNEELYRLYKNSDMVACDTCPLKVISGVGT